VAFFALFALFMVFALFRVFALLGVPRPFALPAPAPGREALPAFARLAVPFTRAAALFAAFFAAISWCS
jgi:hypothetical protein